MSHFDEKDFSDNVKGNVKKQIQGQSHSHVRWLGDLYERKFWMFNIVVSQVCLHRYTYLVVKGNYFF